MVGLDGREILNSSPSIICSSPSISTPLAKSDSVRQKRPSKGNKEKCKISKDATSTADPHTFNSKLNTQENATSSKKKNIKSSKAKAAARRKARQKKKKKQQQQNKMKKQDQENSMDDVQPSSANMEAENKVKRVRFADVQVREYARKIGGGGGVPGQGSWSLGLGEVKVDYIIGTVNNFEARRAEELERRTQALADPHLRSIADGETRQFSHKSGAGNPLMGRRTEKERKELLKEALSEDDDLRFSGGEYAYGRGSRG